MCELFSKYERDRLSITMLNNTECSVVVLVHKFNLQLLNMNMTYQNIFVFPAVLFLYIKNFKLFRNTFERNFVLYQLIKCLEYYSNNSSQSEVFFSRTRLYFALCLTELLVKNTEENFESTF